MFRQDIITREIVDKWKEKNGKSLEAVCIKDIEMFGEAIDEDDDSSSD